MPRSGSPRRGASGGVDRHRRRGRGSGRSAANGGTGRLDLAAWFRLVAPEERRGHPARIVELGVDLLRRGADLAACPDADELRRDLEIYAYGHDLFRFAGSRMLLRTWRDLCDVAAPTDSTATEDVEWHNPVMLHGRIRRRWLELDPQVQHVIGVSRFERLRLALDTHTVGAVERPAGSAGVFVRLAHLADLIAAAPGDAAIADIWDDAFTVDGLERAYCRASALKAERLVRRGRFVSERTRSFCTLDLGAVGWTAPVRS